jgi:hypothetical protein
MEIEADKYLIEGVTRRAGDNNVENSPGDNYS